MRLRRGEHLRWRMNDARVSRFWSHVGLRSRQGKREACGYEQFGTIRLSLRYRNPVCSIFMHLYKHSKSRCSKRDNVMKPKWVADGESLSGSCLRAPGAFQRPLGLAPGEPKATGEHGETCWLSAINCLGPTSDSKDGTAAHAQRSPHSISWTKRHCADYASLRIELPG